MAVMSFQMSPGSVLVDRMGSLRRNLQQEAKSLQDVCVFSRKLEPFTDCLRNEFAKCLGDLDALIAGAEAKEVPNQYVALARIQQTASTLFGEALALRLADSIRGQLDNGLCQVADHLLKQFAQLVTLQIPQITTMAEAEFYGTASRVIRLRYPAKSIWDLPVLAHEFAHSFGPLWTTGCGNIVHPRESFLRNPALGSPALLDEYFSDLLATFILGPAYVCTCIVDRFIPTIDRDGPKHPAHTKRAWWILKGLELLSELVEDSEDRSDFRLICCELRQFWASCLGLAGVEDLRDYEQQPLHLAANQLFSQFKTNLSLAPYTNPRNAWRLVADFKEQNESDCSNCNVRDILNAAWFMRLQLYRSNTSFDPLIEKWMLDLARRLS
jgi:hypothetical protein